LLKGLGRGVRQLIFSFRRVLDEEGLGQLRDGFAVCGTLWNFGDDTRRQVAGADFGYAGGI
jgi:hypothetical protein